MPPAAPTGEQWLVSAAVATVAGLALAAGTAVALFVACALLLATGLILFKASLMPALLMLVVLFPKSGASVDGFPLPVLLPLLVGSLLAACYRWRGRAQLQLLVLPVLSLAWLAATGLRVAQRGDAAAVLGTAAWYGSSAVVLLLVLLLVHCPQPPPWCARAHRWILAGLVLACIYGAAQYVFGLQRLSVPGLTLALGDSYREKPLQLPTGGFKVPSTYANGNLIGIVVSFFIVLLLTRLAQGRSRLIPTTLLCLPLGAQLLLSGSRTAILATAAGGAIAVFSGRRPARALVLAAVGVAGSVAAALQIPTVARRLGGGNLTEATGAGRTGVWHDLLLQIEWWEIFIGQADWPERTLAEGAPGIVQQVGLVGLVLWIAPLLLLLSSRRFRPFAPAWAVIAVSAMLDSAYAVFPTLFIPLVVLLCTAWQAPERTHGVSTRPSFTYA